MLTASRRLFVRKDGDAIVGRIAGELRRVGVCAIETIEDEDAPAEAVGIEQPFFAGRCHDK
jgi:hypothetical protein